MLGPKVAALEDAIKDGLRVAYERDHEESDRLKKLEETLAEFEDGGKDMPSSGG